MSLNAVRFLNTKLINKAVARPGMWNGPGFCLCLTNTYLAARMATSVWQCNLYFQAGLRPQLTRRWKSKERLGHLQNTWSNSRDCSKSSVIAWVSTTDNDIIQCESLCGLNWLHTQSRCLLGPFSRFASFLFEFSVRVRVSVRVRRHTDGESLWSHTPVRLRFPAPFH